MEIKEQEPIQLYTQMIGLHMLLRPHDIWQYLLDLQFCHRHSG